jgi:multidrug resistance efflux pump
MIMPSRGIRVVWLLGIVLLLGTAAGARMIMDQPASGTTPPSPAEPQILGIVGLGFADVKGGIVALHPAQSGRVESVLVEEGDEVKAGDLLFSLDNRMQKKKLDLAEAALAAAKIKVKDDETQLPKKWQAEVDKQQAQLESARKKLDAAEIQHKIDMKLAEDPSRQLSEDLKDIAKRNLESAQKAFKAQEAAVEVVKAMNPQAVIDSAREDVKAKQAQRDLAHLAFQECDLYAPAEGSVLRLFAQPGEMLTAQPRQPAVQFCPSTPRVIRVEILQDWAGKVKEGQAAFIEDDTRAGVQWKGKVERVGDWFGPRRIVLQEPFQFNDLRTLECIVTLDANSPPIRINQRVRVTIK